MSVWRWGVGDLVHHHLLQQHAINGMGCVAAEARGKLILHIMYYFIVL